MNEVVIYHAAYVKNLSKTKLIPFTTYRGKEQNKLPCILAVNLAFIKNLDSQFYSEIHAIV